MLKSSFKRIFHKKITNIIWAVKSCPYFFEKMKPFKGKRSIISEWLIFPWVNRLNSEKIYGKMNIIHYSDKRRELPWAKKRK